MLMNTWSSQFSTLGPAVLPPFSHTRILMMPVCLDDLSGTLPPALYAWLPLMRSMRAAGPCRSGTAYLTIDEREVAEGGTHRRPGLHVDGWADDGGGSWGGGGWGGREAGMLVVASHTGSVVYPQRFEGVPRQYGDCEHLREQCRSAPPLRAGVVYRLQGMTVHEAIPVHTDARRQFVRLSMPSRAGWPCSNTPNPLGVPPSGPILPARLGAFTQYDPQRRT